MAVFIFINTMGDLFSYVHFKTQLARGFFRIKIGINKCSECFCSYVETFRGNASAEINITGQENCQSGTRNCHVSFPAFPKGKWTGNCVASIFTIEAGARKYKRYSGCIFTIFGILLADNSFATNEWPVESRSRIQVLDSENNCQNKPPKSTKRWFYIGWMLGHGLRYWPNILAT